MQMPKGSESSPDFFTSRELLLVGAKHNGINEATVHVLLKHTVEGRDIPPGGTAGPKGDK